MVISPLLLDQPANAERVRRLGVARVIMPENYRADTLIDELGCVLDDASYAQNAQHFSKLLASENGPSEACRIIERMAAA
jgi:UDP:flavonoid glycosyltransferase YjiC (YdhE family)